ncbi:MAG: hypothetical protein PHG00_10850 [Methylococcales bacterium]|nr:hypothetical protein [Methylococcales bacterium]
MPDTKSYFNLYVGCNRSKVIIAFGRDAVVVSILHQFGSGCFLNNMDVRVDLLDN